jgi:hypothetical protein
MTSEYLDSLRRLVGDNRLEQVVGELLKKSEELGNGVYRDRILQLSAQYNDWLSMRMTNTESNEGLTRARNRISLGLLDAINLFPRSGNNTGQATGAGLKLNGVSENRLRKQLFSLYLLPKIGVILFPAFLHATGSFTSQNTLTFQLLLSLLALVYTILYLWQRRDQRRVLRPNDVRVSRRHANLYRFFLSLYPLMVFMFFDFSGRGYLPVSSLLLLLFSTEVIFGVALGRNFFRKYPALLQIE